MNRFSDLQVKTRFFDDPRSFFDDAREVESWTEECPALAFVLARLLAREASRRLESAERVAEALEAIIKGDLPDVLRLQLAQEREAVVQLEFAERFYERLRAALPMREFSKKQPAVLIDALDELIDYRPKDYNPGLRRRAKQHDKYHLTAEEIDAFRMVFVELVTASSQGGRSSGDAWNAALKLGLNEMKQRLPASAP